MRRTRSSALRETQVESEEEGEIVVVPRRGAAPNDVPPPQPPPPPPPPPIRPTDSVAVQTTKYYSGWNMTLMPSNHTAPPVRIAISNTMTTETLGRCIVQATYGCHDAVDDFQISVRVINTCTDGSSSFASTYSPANHGNMFVYHLTCRASFATKPMSL